MTNHRSRVTAVLLTLVAVLAGGGAVAAGAGPLPAVQAAVAQAECGDTSGFEQVPLSELPPEAGETYELIQAGGPFPYPEDGGTFHNREGLLPDCAEGYYAEYTVETPGSDDRGARRIVAGDGGEHFYTADHYASFVLIVA